ncbi:AAA_family ATPase [Hexamita inflata]|uniref:AAA family ATPase n=1 Tax=Hexamita inflata TaxID=28002 RepID=A0AA86UQK6_9EUKA|nr:AAA family ATPase [Hexamita inflata]
MFNGRVLQFQQCVNEYLQNTVGFRNLKNSKYQPSENCYLLGLQLLLLGRIEAAINKHISKVLAKTEGECVNGYYDISVVTVDNKIGCILELKQTKNSSEMLNECEKALELIEREKYDQSFVNDKVQTIYKYGMTFCGKLCKLIVNKQTLKQQRDGSYKYINCSKNAKQ